MLPPELLTPGNLILTSFLGIGLAIGAAVVYVKKNLMTPTQSTPSSESTDVILAGGSFLDLTKFDEVKVDIKRIAVALEQLVELRRRDAADEELEDRIATLFEKFSKKTR